MNAKAKTHIIDAVKVIASLLRDAYGEDLTKQGAYLTIHSDGEARLIGPDGEVIMKNYPLSGAITRLIEDAEEKTK